MGKDDFKSIRQKAALTVFGCPVEVEYFYYPGIPATEDEPEVYEEVEVESVWFEEFDIISLCGQRAIGEIEKQIYELIDKQKEEV